MLVNVGKWERSAAEADPLELKLRELCIELAYVSSTPCYLCRGAADRKGFAHAADPRVEIGKIGKTSGILIKHDQVFDFFSKWSYGPLDGLK